MSSIEDKVVSLRFDNGQFESGVSRTMSTLSKFKEALSFKGADSGLRSISTAASKITLGNIAEGVDSLAKRFSNLGIVGVAALTNITNRLLNFGLDKLKGFTLDPLTQGFTEYQEKMGSIQVMLANTAKYGTKLPAVNKALNDLNHYADQTIYSFSDMTKNVGLFTNAGLRVEEATQVIKGFSNVAAASGTDSTHAATAAYQLSQALSAGRIGLQDWNSLTNAGMGNDNMKRGLIEVATAMGELKRGSKEATKVQEDFRGSLKDGWMTAKVMSTYLGIMANDDEKANRAKMKSLGLTQKQIDTFIREQKTAKEAATMVRTASQLVGTAKEAIGSMWSSIFEILIGDFNQATNLFTRMSNVIGNGINALSNKITGILTQWAKLGGRTAVIEGFANIFKALGSYLAPIGRAFGEIFGGKNGLTGEKLANMSKAFEGFTEHLKISGSTAQAITNIFKVLFGALRTVGSVVGLALKGVAGVFGLLLLGAQKLAGPLVRLVGIIAGWINSAASWVSSGKAMAAVMQVINPALQMFSRWWDAIAARLPSQAQVMAVVNTALERLRGGFNTAMQAMQPFIDKVEDLRDKISSGGLQSALSSLGQTLQNYGRAAEVYGFIAYTVAIQKLGVAAQWVEKQFNSAKTALSNFKSSASGAGGGVKDAMGGMTANIGSNVGGAISEIKSKMGIATTIGNGLKALVIGIAQEAQKIAPYIGKAYDAVKNFVTNFANGIHGMFDNFTPTDYEGVFNVAALTTVALTINKVLDQFGDVVEAFTGIGKAFQGVLKNVGGAINAFAMKTRAETLVLLGVALIAFAGGLLVLSMVNPDKLGGALLALSVILVEMAALMAGLNKLLSGENAVSTVKLVALGVAMIGLAAGMAIMATAAARLGSMDIAGVGKGIAAIGVLLAALAIFMNKTNFSAMGVKNAVGILIMSAAMSVLSKSIEKLGGMDTGNLVQGTAALSVAMLAITGAIKLMGNPQKMLTNALAMVLIAVAIGKFVTTVDAFGHMDFSTLAKGFGTLVIALGVLVAAFRLIPQNAGALGLSLGVALGALTLSLKTFGEMSFGELLKGVTTLAVAMGILVTAMLLMEGGVAGAGAMVIMAAAIAILVPVIAGLGQLSWGEILKGLAGLAGALLVLGLAAAGLGLISPLIAALATALLALGAAVLLIGAGMALFGTGFAAAAAVIVASGAALLAFFAGMVMLLPTFGNAIAGFVTNFVGHILAAVPGWVAAFGIIINAILQVIINAAPRLAQAAIALLTAFLNVIVTMVPRIAAAGVAMIIGLLAAIGSRIGMIVTVAARLAVNFMNAIGANAPRVAQAGVQMIIKVINAIANAVNTNAPRIRQAALNLAKALVNAFTGGVNPAAALRAVGNFAKNAVSGLANGLRQGIQNVAAEAGRLASAAINAIKSKLKINSPSKVMREIGSGVPEGLAQGVAWNHGYVTDAVSDLGGAAISHMAGIIADVGKVIDTNMDVNPTITPVLDISQLARDAKSINGLVSTNAAASISSSLTAQRLQADGSTSAGSIMTAEKPTMVFNQYNNSPKALSALDIYRNTRAALIQGGGTLRA